MVLSFVNRSEGRRRAGPLVLVTLAVIAYGCGSSDTTVPTNVNKPGTIKLKPEDSYTYEGTGTAKRKVELDRRERVRHLHDAAKKAD